MTAIDRLSKKVSLAHDYSVCTQKPCGSHVTTSESYLPIEMGGVFSILPA
jgi:hypothetical protein